VRPSWRLSLLVLAFVSLAFGVAGGLARLTPLPVSINALALHGPLMVSAFFGTVISLERAAQLDRPWAYVAPLCAGLAGVLMLLGLPAEGFLLMTFAGALLLVASLLAVKRQPALERAAAAGGALAWLAGSLSLLAGFAAVPWWIAFFALTIGAERLELARGLRHPAARLLFLLIASALVVAPLMPRVQGVVLVLLALWLFAFDPVRAALRQTERPRYVAICVLSGCFWLAAGGALMALSAGYDAALHAIFLGFAFSMVFGHAPVPYSTLLYGPLALLHASLVVRVLLSREAGGWGNAAALALFAALAAALAASRAWSGRRRR
jgi:hypothetical protein